MSDLAEPRFEKAHFSSSPSGFPEEIARLFDCTRSNLLRVGEKRLTHAELTSRSLDNLSFLSILRLSLRITVVETFHPSFTIEIERSGVETFNVFRVQELMSQNENSCISVLVPPDVRPSRYWHSLCEKSITRCVCVDKF